ncbi:MAG: type II toxin-antitoxin system Phd/YefM family antitoxin [Cyanobacteriota bacterium]|nr:type II toxin-antitoxin system Phd/YefM family antitoxin [Cyanobacteriota bacterium]
MHSYKITDAKEHYREVFDRAKKEPVLLTEESNPSHVILSVETYQKLVERLEELEDILFGKQADIALNQSQMVGSQQFTATLQKIANGEA